jgi:hypothetical protein
MGQALPQYDGQGKASHHEESDDNQAGEAAGGHGKKLPFALGRRRMRVALGKPHSQGFWITIGQTRRGCQTETMRFAISAFLQ